MFEKIHRLPTSVNVNVAHDNAAGFYGPAFVSEIGVIGFGILVPVFGPQFIVDSYLTGCRLFGEINPVEKGFNIMAQFGVWGEIEVPNLYGAVIIDMDLVCLGLVQQIVGD